MAEGSIARVERSATQRGAPHNSLENTMPTQELWDLSFFAWGVVCGWAVVQGLRG